MPIDVIQHSFPLRDVNFAQFETIFKIFENFSFCLQMFCAVQYCANEKRKLRSFSFPKDTKLCEKWIQFCQRPSKINTKLEKICVDHFLSEDFERDLPYELGVYSKPRPLKLKSNAVPSVQNKTDEYFGSAYEQQKPKPVQTKTWKTKNVAQRKQIVDALLEEYDEQMADQGAQLEMHLGAPTIEDDDVAELPAEEVVQVVIDADAYLTALEKEKSVTAVL